MSMLHKLDSVKFLEKFGKVTVSITSHIKIRIKADQAASDFTKSCLFIVILIFHDHFNDCVLNLLSSQYFVRFLPAFFQTFF